MRLTDSVGICQFIFLPAVIPRCKIHCRSYASMPARRSSFNAPTGRKTSPGMTISHSRTDKQEFPVFRKRFRTSSACRGAFLAVSTMAPSTRTRICSLPPSSVLCVPAVFFPVFSGLFRVSDGMLPVICRRAGLPSSRVTVIETAALSGSCRYRSRIRVSRRSSLPA